MLVGRKPMAVFADGEGNFPDVVDRYLQLFDRQVAIGQLRRFDQIKPTSSLNIHWIYFTLPGHEWRVDAYIELFARESVWDQASEREQGRLLGYSDRENDIWEQRFPYRPLDRR